MKKIINFKKGKVFIHRNIIVGLVLGIIMLTFISSILLLNLITYAQSSRPLGIAPKGVEELPKDDSTKAGKFITENLEKEFKNKIVVIFYFDGYLDNEKGTADAKILKDTLQNSEPYKNLAQIISYKIITSGKICEVKNSRLFCEPRHIDALRKLGIEHIKIVILNENKFENEIDSFYGADSVITLSTNKRPGFKENIKKNFLDLLGKSFGEAVGEMDREEYIKAVLSCFYGNKSSYSYGLFKFKSCEDFKKNYPDFWKYDVE